MDSNDNNNSLLGEVKNDVNIRSKSFAKKTINTLFDYLEDCVTETIKDSDKRATFLNTIRMIFTKPETEEIVVKTAGEILADKGLLPEEYRHWDDEIWFHNLHQEEYMHGKYIGYLLAVIALYEKDAPIELLQSVEDSMTANIPAYGLGGKYGSSDEVMEKFDKAKLAWKQRNGIQT